MEAYRIVKRLADSGIVVATPGNPVKYTGKPIEQVVAMMMDRQMKKLEEMERGRDEVISLGRTVPAPTRPDEKYSFRMIQGREQIYSQVLSPASPSWIERQNQGCAEERCEVENHQRR